MGTMYLVLPLVGGLLVRHLCSSLVMVTCHLEFILGHHLMEAILPLLAGTKLPVNLNKLHQALDTITTINNPNSSNSLLGGFSAPVGAGYNCGQPLPNYNNQESYGDAAYPQTSTGQQGYVQDGYSGGYNAHAQQPGYSQTTSNTQGGYDQQAYGSTFNYGTMAVSSQDGSANASSAQGGSTQASPAQPPLSQPPNYTLNYPSQGTAPSGYGQVMPPSYGQPPQAQTPPNSQSVYRQCQIPSAPASYMQSAPLQPSYGQPPLSQSAHRQQQSYGVQPHSPSGYGNQQQPPYNNSYASGGNSQTSAYSNDNVAQEPHDTAAVVAPSITGGAPTTNAPAP